MGRKDELQELNARLQLLESEKKKSEEDSRILREQLFKITAQTARTKVTNSQRQKLRRNVKQLYENSFLETAISIFEWQDLPEPEDNVGGTRFDSKRIESMIARCGRVAIFPHEYEFLGLDGKAVKKKTYLAMPFSGSYGLDPYGEFGVVRPYAAFGGGGQSFGNKIVNKDCVIVTDFFYPTITAGNTSFTVKKAIEMYAEMMADCEVAKKVNRNWVKLPMLFGIDTSDKEAAKLADALALEIKQLLYATEDNEDAFISRAVPYLKTLNTNVQYFGKELTEEIKNYKNEIYEFLGIAHNQNEKKERQIVPEIDVAADQYNSSITKRLMNRTAPLEQAKRLWPEDWQGVNIKVNLNGYNEREEDDGAMDVDSERDR